MCNKRFSAFRGLTPSARNEEDSSQKYGYDDFSDSPSIHWKSVATEDSDDAYAWVRALGDRQLANLQIQSSHTAIASVSPSSPVGIKQKLTITGVSSGLSDITIGGGGPYYKQKLGVEVYEYREVNVAVRVVNLQGVYQTTDVSENDIQNAVDRIYQQGICKINITKLDPIDIAFDKTATLNNCLDNNDPERWWLPLWSDEEQEIIDNADVSPEEYDYIIFLVDNPVLPLRGKAEVGGRYMFAYPDANLPVAYTCAHEIGHAVFSWGHDFQNDKENIMYAPTSDLTEEANEVNNGKLWTRLRRGQWNDIHQY